MDTFNRMTDEELVFACNNGGYCILIGLIASTNDMLGFYEEMIRTTRPICSAGDEKMNVQDEHFL